MSLKTALLTLSAASLALAYPWVVRAPGVDTSLLPTRSSLHQVRDSATCPNNPNHVPAAPITSQYPYLGAINGQQGTGIGGIRVPAVGDTIHYYQPPGPNDIRGPCPGINTMANHGFIARDGIVTYNELVDAQQNVFNVGYDLANLLAVAGVGLDGDLVGTEKLSIGCDATSRTASMDSLLADELGLNGHNHFEGDASLTRNDYFTGNGDNYRWNATLFTSMMSYCNGNCTRENLSKYRMLRYNESRASNPNFFFGPGALLLYGAASFLYELFPGNSSTADEKTMMSLFGANKTASETYVWNGGERLPEVWYNRNSPYSSGDVGNEIGGMYGDNPVAFGGNLGTNNFDGLNYSTVITNGDLDTSTVSNLMCFMSQLLTSSFPAELGVVIDLPEGLVSAISSKLAPFTSNLGCPMNPDSGSESPGN